ncbi:MAG: hypothetical protein IPN97_03645 [Saprospiraceae bacterium]|nr:hypothetical protein [Saprospiraceae bacterium]
MKQNIKLIKYGFTSFLLIILCYVGMTQPVNDECRFAIKLNYDKIYCSDDNQFTNVGATSDPSFPEAQNACVFLTWENGVWFSFTPKNFAASIRLFGQGNGGTIRSPKILLFDDCNNFLACSPGNQAGVVEFIYDNLTPGKPYLIYVESSTDGQGNFKLCIDEFKPVPSPQADCKSGVILCDKSPFVVDSLLGGGMDRNEIEPGNCIEAEFQSSWYKWTCDKPGSLTFTLTPNNHRGRNFESDDIDFAVYEMINGLDDCSRSSRVLIRCMAAGAQGDGAGNSLPLSRWIDCNGPTGLRSGEADFTETAGCAPGNNNFVAPLSMETGKSYLLVINNYTRSGLGFEIEFGGEGTFLGPEVDFEVEAQNKFECDKTLRVINNSMSLTDPIVSYSWSFGNRSVPSSSTDFGPHDILYQSFGNKTIALTVKSSKGCLVTQILDFFVEPCCKDTSTLTLAGIPRDLRCFQIPEGQITASVIKGGSPEFEYSIDNGVTFQTNDVFRNLNVGEYNLTVRDIKGCQHDTVVIINEPPPVIADAIEDKEIELGEETTIQGLVIQSVNGIGSTVWQPEADIVDFNPVTYLATVFPKSTSTYIFTVTDTLGCTATAEVTIRVNKNYNLAYPNVIKIKNAIDPANGYFNVFGNRSVKYVEYLEIYDRWGNLVYKGYDSRLNLQGVNTFEFNKTLEGWNGIFNGKEVDQGVYAWLARVRYIDEHVATFSGDLTVLDE